MRSAVFGIAILVLGLGVFRFAVPAMMEEAISGGSDDCDASHLTSKDLEQFIPEDTPGLEQVYRSVQHCKSGDIPREAELNLAYAADDPVEAAARTFLADAERDGWTRVSPPAGKSIFVTNGAVNLSLRRARDGQTVHVDAYLFVAASKPNPNPNANISSVQATGAPTGALVRIWVEGQSAIPTIGAGNFGVFPPPDMGIGR